MERLSGGRVTYEGVAGGIGLKNSNRLSSIKLNGRCL
jgi:hypothetical protein